MVSDWEEETNLDEFQTTWRMYPDLTITPTENSQENPTTPSEPEKTSNEPATPTKPTQETEKESQTTEKTENKTEQTKNETNNPKTGDNIIISVILFVASIVAICVLTIAKRKKSRE